jgi:hypothetical protein
VESRRCARCGWRPRRERRLPKPRRRTGEPVDGLGPPSWKRRPLTIAAAGTAAARGLRQRRALWRAPSDASIRARSTVRQASATQSHDRFPFDHRARTGGAGVRALQRPTRPSQAEGQSLWPRITSPPVRLEPMSRRVIQPPALAICSSPLAIPAPSLIRRCAFSQAAASDAEREKQYGFGKLTDR